MDYESSSAWRIACDSASSHEESDETLARGVAKGDPRAWDKFFDRFLRWTYRFAFYHLQMNHADAEDLCSDIMQTAAGCIDKYNPARGTLDVWLLGVAKHRLIRFCKRRRMEIPQSPELMELEAESDSWEEKALTRDEIHSILASLPERQAAVLIGKYLEDRSVDELAKMLSTTPKAVEMLLRRARQTFRAELTGGDSNE